MAKRCLQKNLGLLAVLFLMLIPGMRSNAQLNPAMGQSPWKYANPTPHGLQLLDMSFIDNRTGLGVGFNGVIAKTTDSGYNWQYINYKFVTPTNTVSLASFNDVQFVTPNIAYAVGFNGLMIKTTDAGQTWMQVNTPLTIFNKNILGLHFINKDTGYIGGQPIISGNTTSIDNAPKIYFTKNGGATWDSLASPFRPAQNTVTLSGFNGGEINRIVFVNDSVGYVCGSTASSVPTNSAILWKIENGVVKDYSLHRSKFGNTTGQAPAQCTQTYRGLVAINDSLVIMSSNTNGIAVRVKTGKNDSTANAMPAIYGAYERGTYEVVFQMNINPTIPVGANLSTGSSWHMKKAPNGNILMSNGNKLAFSPDNGTTWFGSQPVSNTSNIAHWSYTAMDVTPNGRIIMAGINGITTDSLPGSKWRTQYKNVRPLFYSFSDIDWADCNNGVVVGSSGTIAKTSDGGRTWVDNSNPVFDAAGLGFGNVFYHNVNSMFFSTYQAIYKSADQGSTNDVIFTEPNTNAQLNNFTMQGPDRAWAIGYRFSPAVQRTVIFRSLNANAAAPVWDTVKTFPTGNLAPQLRKIQFANQDTGYVSANRGKVYRTIDGGNSWTDVSPDTLVNGNANNNYTGLSVVDGRTIYISGSSRKLFKSTDAGATWTDLTLAVPPSPTVINAFTSLGLIVMNDANNGYIAAGGALLKTDNGWSTWTYDLAPIGMQNMSLYPKMNLPIQNKKLYIMSPTAGFGGSISTQSAFLVEYGSTSMGNLSSTETIVNASCTNPTGGSITVNASGTIAPYTYSINGGAFQTSNSFTGLTQGTKTIAIKDAACGLISKTVTVGLTDNLTLTAAPSDTSVCAGIPVQLRTTSNAATYAWSPATGLSNAAIANPVATNNSNRTYTLTASLNGCVKTNIVNISIKANPVISAGPDKTIVNGADTRLEGIGTSNTVFIAWTPAATLTNPGTVNPLAKPSETTRYTLTIRNSEGCVSTDEAVVSVIPYCVKVMNAFTPNGDAINDRWLVTTGDACTNQVMVKVFNRYGAEVYSNDNYKNDWDGNYKGKPVADGTYYYSIKYRLISGKVVPVQGDVTILR